SAPSRPIGCLASGFIPAPVSFSWSPAPPAPGPAPIPPALGQSGAGNMQMLTPKQISIGSAPSTPTKVSTPGRSRPPQPHKPRPPAVSVFQSCPAPDVVELLCLVTDFAPPTATIDWLMDGDVVEPGHAHTEEATPGHAPGRFRAVSRLNVSAAEWRDHQRFSCRVRHGPTRRCRRCRRRGPPPPTPPPIFAVPSDLYISQSPKLLCLVTNLPSDDGLVVTWRRAAGGALDRQPLPLRMANNFNGTFTAGEPLPRRAAGGAGGKRHAPSVFLFPPPPEEISSSLPTLSLTCLVRGFSPDSIDVQWQKNLGGSGGSGADGRFFLYSRLEATRDEWERGDAFVCTVVHEGLPLRFLQRSVRKPPVIDSLTSVS
uniref:Uncharacterized protein n=1 Tax=Geospiza parvula TaxID=87175 RepID=A0A8U8AWR3_GEOPR